MFGFYRISAVVPQLKVADVKFNTAEIIHQYNLVSNNGGSLALFPELAVTGASCGDLFGQQTLQSAVSDALEELRCASRETVLVCGLPFPVGFRLFNMVAILQNQRLLGLVPKQTSCRNFAPGKEAPEKVNFRGTAVPCGPNLVFSGGDDFSFGIEIGNDRELLTSPGTLAGAAGAQIICNPSAEIELAGGREFRRNCLQMYSNKLAGAYIYCGAGVHESTANGVYSGHALIAMLGEITAETPGFQRESQIIYGDIKPKWSNILRQKRRFAENSALTAVAIDLPVETANWEYLHLKSRPFIPVEPERCAGRCQELFAMQSAALAKRVEHTGSQSLVLGISGGLDSTLALLVCAECCDLLKLPRSKILAVTMPGFGTTSRTRNNAEQLATELGARLLTIPIASAVRTHFQDIGHNEDDQDVVYENAQARERTQILMDLANQEKGLCIGTGDLSELALGWCTFNGDQMAMYGVNAAVPKTLIRFMVAYYANSASENLRQRLLDVNATPVSPELVPGKQETEKLLGNYDIHDFYLYYFIRYGETPDCLLALAVHAFDDKYQPQELQSALKIFIRRFFTSQFKRNSLPDGPKLGTVSLSPQGDWIMPSDSSFALWM